MPVIILITGHFSNSVKFRGNVEVRGKGQILQLGLKFRGPRETVGPIYGITLLCILFGNTLLG